MHAGQASLGATASAVCRPTPAIAIASAPQVTGAHKGADKRRFELRHQVEHVDVTDAETHEILQAVAEQQELMLRSPDSSTQRDAAIEVFKLSSVLLHIGRHEESLAACEAAANKMLALCGGVHKDPLTVAEVQGLRSLVLAGTGRPWEALAAVQEAVAACRMAGDTIWQGLWIHVQSQADVACLQHTVGHFDAAVISMREAVALGERARGERAPAVLELREQLAMCMFDQGQHRDALAEMACAVKLCETIEGQSSLPAVGATWMRGASRYRAIVTEDDPSEGLFTANHVRISNVRMLLEAGKHEEAGKALPHAITSLRAQATQPWHPGLFEKLWDSLLKMAITLPSVAATEQCIKGMQAMATHTPETELDRTITRLPEMAIKDSQIQLALLRLGRSEDAANQAKVTLAKVIAKYGEGSGQAAFTRWQLGYNSAYKTSDQERSIVEMEGAIDSLVALGEGSMPELSIMRKKVAQLRSEQSVRRDRKN